MSPSCGSSAPSSQPRWPGPISAASTSSPPRRASFSRRDRSRSSSRWRPARSRPFSVSNGSLVQAGDVLVELDRSAALADAEGARAELASARAEILRRKTALLSARSHRFDPVPAIDWPEGTSRRRCASARTRVLAADLGQLAANVASFDAERAQKTAEARQTEGDDRDAEEPRRDPAGARRHAHEARRNEGRRARPRSSTPPRRCNIKSRRRRSRSRIWLRSTAGLEVIARNSDKAVQDFISENAQKLEDAERRAEDVEQRLAKAQAELDHLTLRAPIAGRVQSSIITNVGQVVTSGQEIMRIVPEDSGLEIQAYVRNRDIGFVSVGQEAVVKIESFPFTRYGVDQGACHAHRQGRDPRARRQCDRGRSDARLECGRLRRRRAHAESGVPGRAEARRRNDHGRRR